MNRKWIYSHPDKAFYPQTGATILAVLAATSDEVSSGKHRVLYLHLYIWMTIFTYEVSILIQKLNFLTSIINTGIVVDASEGKVPHSTANIFEKLKTNFTKQESQDKAQVLLRMKDPFS